MMIFASWIRDKLKGYSRHIEYAMESAEKTGLFQKYVLRKKDGDKWCIGVFDENGRLMELVTSDSPAGAIVEAALIYNRMPKEEKTAGKKGRKVRKRRIYRPKRILRIFAYSGFSPGCPASGWHSAGEGRCGTFFPGGALDERDSLFQAPLPGVQRAETLFEGLSNFLRGAELHGPPGILGRGEADGIPRRPRHRRERNARPGTSTGQDSGTAGTKG
jgi:hypothetical protein